MDFIKQAEKWEQKWAWFCPDKFQNAFEDYIRAGNQFKNITNDADSAIDAYKRAEALLPKLNNSDDHLKQRVYKCLAEAYCKKEDFNSAENYYLEAAKFARSVGKIFNDCGIMYLGHDYKKAAEHFQRSAENGYSRNYLNAALALARHYPGYNEEVVELFRKALKNCKMTMNYDANVKLYSLLSRNQYIISSIYSEFPGSDTLVEKLRHAYEKKAFDDILSRNNIELSPENDTWRNVMLLRIRNTFVQSSDSDDIC